MPPPTTLSDTPGLQTPSSARPARPRPATEIGRLPGTRTGWAMRAVYLLSDLVAFMMSLAVAKLAVDLIRGVLFSTTQLTELKLYALWTIGLVAVAAAQQTYAAIPPRPVRKFRGWVLGSLTVCVAIVGGAWLLEIGWLSLYVTLAVASGLAVLWASFCRAICRIAFGSATWWGTRLIVVSSDGLAARAHADLAREPQWGLRPVGYVDDNATADDSASAAHWLGTLDQLDEVAEKLNVDWALVAEHSLEADELADLLSRANSRIKHWIILPPLARLPSLWLEACEAARRPALAITNRLALPWSQFVKRAFDVVVTLALGLLALPLIGLAALLIRLGSAGPIFYGSERVGRHGRRFKAWKFRSMYTDADEMLMRYLNEHPELAVEWEENTKLRDDPRVTWIGRWLRVTSLDELPQLWNILVGDMSLVGPRPILPWEISKYGDYYEHCSKVLPGLTGLWQVSGRNNTTYRERLELDTYYVRNWSLWLDIYILACTVKVVLLGEGAY